MSNLSIFKIGVGPSSSHTLGPMIACNMFCDEIQNRINDIHRVKITLYGSLSLTGKGHLTDKAVIWGLSGLKAKDLNPDIQSNAILMATNNNILNLSSKKQISFSYEDDIVFSEEFLPMHENAMLIESLDDCNNVIYKQVYYSIGGGFIMNENEMSNYKDSNNDSSKLDISFNNASDCIRICNENNWNLAQLSYHYECQFNTKEYIRSYCMEIWNTMQEVYLNGITSKNTHLPGQLHLKRRAIELNKKIRETDDPMGIIDFISLYAIAIAEENASGSKVVTAPTNGACAVIPAVMLYMKNHIGNFNDDHAINFLLTSMLIGYLYRKNASISGAEAGCQAEIGSASSMAAASMATILGADAIVSCSAAEIAMEHHLGLTCDPVAGLVQIPCIERNAFGAIKAISAARMAMSRKSDPTVHLDDIIKTMYETGKDMDYKYKETSLGGLAKNITVC